MLIGQGCSSDVCIYLPNISHLVQVFSNIHRFMVPIAGNCCRKSARGDNHSMDRNEEDFEFISGVVEGTI